MATFRKRNGRWYAEIYRKGNRKGKTFHTKAEAIQWAAAEEREASMLVPNKLVSEAMERYAEEVSPTKRGKRWEQIRLTMFGKDDLAKVNLRDLDQSHISAWRDRRLRSVSAESVRREWSLLSNVFSVAMNEWKWLIAHPMKGVKRPAPAQPRTRRVDDDEINRLSLALGYEGGTAETETARVALAMLFSLETAMRAGEIVGLTDKDVDIGKRVAHLPKTKNGNSRDVPLSKRAVDVLEHLPEVEPGAPLFGLKSSSLDTLFRKAKGRALIEDLHFHDLRAEALTRMAMPKERGGKGIDVMTLARISGHKDLRILMNTYYRETAEDIAARLD